MACLSPPRLSRCRWVFPEDAGIGATPQSIANAASEWSLSVFSTRSDEELPGGVGADAVEFEQ